MIVASACRKYAHVKKETNYAELEYQGHDRSYLVHLPENYDSTKQYPLIFVLHGITSRAKAIAGFSGFNEVADKKEFIVCYPQGYKRSWGIDINVGPAPKAGIDDLGFMERLIDTLGVQYSIDTSKVYSCGISNGGFMTMSMACNRSERLAGIAIVCGNMFAPTELYYPDDKPMPLLLIAATEDPLLEYDGEVFKKEYAFLGYPKTIEYWKERNNYPDLKDSVVFESDPKDKTTVVRHYNSNANNPNKIELYEIKGGGHGWPGRGRDIKALFLGKISNEIHTAEIIADFFLSK
jgi:polyhydroxybutyrate depolymerase